MTSSGVNPYLRPATLAASGPIPITTKRFFSHRPATFTSVWWWLVAGVVRDWRGTIAALFAAWFGVPTAIVFAILTGVWLGVVGYVGGAFVSGDVTADVPIWGEVLSTFAPRVSGGWSSHIGRRERSS